MMTISRSIIVPVLIVPMYIGIRPAPAAASPQPAALPKPVAFLPCATCHSTDAGKTIVGPSLAKISGRKAGTLVGFRFSEALKKSGLVWNVTTLDKWLTSPQKTVPGTRMPFAGIADPAKRKEVVDYLVTLK
jgi:cytochrome c